MFSGCQKTLLPSVSIVLNRLNAITIEKYPILSTLPRSTSTHIYQHKSSGVDLIAAFTDGLLERKTTEWQKNPQKLATTKSASKEDSVDIQSLLVKINNLCHSTDIRTLNAGELDLIIISTLEKRDRPAFDSLVDQCVKYSIVPSIEVLLRVLPLLSVCNVDNAIDVASKLLSLCEAQNPSVYIENIALRPFQAQLLWNHGNCTETLDLLYYIYGHADVKRNIGDIYRRIIDDTIMNRGEAIMHNLVTHGDDILKTYNDAAVLYYIWSKCFTSEGFVDQQLAADLFRKYEKLREMTKVKTSILVYTLLQRNNLDGLHRLIEQFLSFEMKKDCGICMEMLFQYQFERNNKRACSEIMTNSIELDLELSSQCVNKFLQMLLRKPLKPLTNKEIVLSSKYNLKF